MNFTEALAEALRRMAAQERETGAGWRRASQWRRSRYYWQLRTVAAEWADEYDARAQIYEDWARAVAFPGGPVSVDYIRYGYDRKNWI